jgi:hypothetical protein
VPGEFGLKYDSSHINVTEADGTVILPNTPFFTPSTSGTSLQVWGVVEGGNPTPLDIQLMYYASSPMNAQMASAQNALYPADAPTSPSQSSGISTSDAKDRDPDVHIYWNSQDVTKKTQTALVGQRISLLAVLPGTQSGATTYTWQVPQTVIKDFDPDKLNNAQVTPLSPTACMRSNVSFVWVDGGTQGTGVAKQVSVVVKNPLGKRTAYTTFNVQQPDVKASVTPYVGGVNGFRDWKPTNDGQGREIVFADPGVTDGMQFSADAPGAWEYAFVQVVTDNKSYIFRPGKGILTKAEPKTGLDKQFPLSGDVDIGGPGKKATNSDAPYISAYPNGGRSVLDASFTTYLMCQVVDTANHNVEIGAFVPLATLSWSVYATVSWPRGAGSPAIVSTRTWVTIEGVKGPFTQGQSFNFSPSLLFPKWASITTDAMQWVR